MSEIDDLLHGVAHTAAIAAKVAEGLDELGVDADEVATRLVEADAQGSRHQPASCPVAVWLADELAEAFDGDGLRVRVDAAHVVVVGRDELRLDLSPPRPVSEFVTRFDSGCYPELEEDRAPQVHVGGVGNFYAPAYAEVDDLGPDEGEEGA